MREQYIGRFTRGGDRPAVVHVDLVTVEASDDAYPEWATLTVSKEVPK